MASDRLREVSDPAVLDVLRAAANDHALLSDGKGNIFWVIHQDVLGTYKAAQELEKEAGLRSKIVRVDEIPEGPNIKERYPDADVLTISLDPELSILSDDD